MTLGSGFRLWRKSLRLFKSQFLVCFTHILKDRWLIGCSCYFLRANVVVDSLCLSHVTLVGDRVLDSLVVVDQVLPGLVFCRVSEWHALNCLLVVLANKISAVMVLIALGKVLDTVCVVIKPDLVVSLVWRQTQL